MEIRGREIPVWVQAAGAIGAFTALLWVIEAVDAAMDNRLDRYGVQPRSDEGLLGILFAPLLHGGWDHLSANSGPLLVLGFLALAAGLLRGIAAAAVIWVVGGVGVWLVAGSNSNHIGASGMVFGFLVYVVVRGVVNRRFWEIAVGAVVLRGFNPVRVIAGPKAPTLPLALTTFLFPSVCSACSVCSVQTPFDERRV